jgi:hypothetical protein
MFYLISGRLVFRKDNGSMRLAALDRDPVAQPGKRTDPMEA